MKALHLTVAGRSTGLVIVAHDKSTERIKRTLSQIRFSDLPANDSYQTLVTDAFFDDPTVQVLIKEDIEVR